MAPPKWQYLKGEAIRWKYAKQYGRAITCLTEALAIMRALPDLLEDVGTTLNYLAFMYLQDEQFANAEATLREAIGWRNRLPADAQHLVADDYMMLSKALSGQGRHREALDAANEGLAWHRKRGSSGAVWKALKDRIKQLKRNLAEANRRERQALRVPSSSM